MTGYKSSTGRYPMEGVFPLSRTLDSLGPLAHTVEDCVLTDAALRGVLLPEARRRPVADLRLVVPETLVLEGCEPAVLANFEAAIDRLAKAGARVERRAMPVLAAIPELIAKHGHILGAEALHLHQERLRGSDATRMDRRVVKRLLMAEKMTAVDLAEVLQTRARLVADTNAFLGDVIVAFPTTPHVVMPIAPLEADDEVFFRNNALTLRNTMLGNFLDWCGVAIPSGADADGMPTSILLSATHGRDAAVLPGRAPLARPRSPEPGCRSGCADLNIVALVTSGLFDRIDAVRRRSFAVVPGTGKGRGRNRIGTP